MNFLSKLISSCHFFLTFMGHIQKFRYESPLAREHFWHKGEGGFPDRSISGRVVGAVPMATSCCETVCRPRRGPAPPPAPAQPRSRNSSHKGSLENVLNRFLNCTWKLIIASVQKSNQFYVPTPVEIGNVTPALGILKEAGRTAN